MNVGYRGSPKGPWGSLDCRDCGKPGVLFREKQYGIPFSLPLCDECYRSRIIRQTVADRQEERDDAGDHN